MKNVYHDIRIAERKVRGDRPDEYLYIRLSAEWPNKWILKGEWRDKKVEWEREISAEEASEFIIREADYIFEVDMATEEKEWRRYVNSLPEEERVEKE
jgi:hypothetical protein